MRKVTCVLQLLDADFDRQIHNNNNNMRAVKRGLVATMGRLETGVLTVLWNQVLQRFQLCSASLQLTNCEEYRRNTQRTRKRNQKYDGSGSLPDEATTAAGTFRVSAFTVIIDSLFAALQKRSQAYEGISARFGFLRNVRSMSSEELSVQSAALVEWFPDDLEASLSGELVQFEALLDTDISRQATRIASQPDATGDDIDVITTGEAVELRMYRLIREKPCNRAFQTWRYCCACISV